MKRSNQRGQKLIYKGNQHFRIFVPIKEKEL